jgi:chlorobactene glucosyltransferase
VPFLGLPRLARSKPSLSDVAPVGAPRVSVIIPARNEAHQIETVTGSVLGTTYPDVEVIVVDDRSTDDTAARVEHLAAADARLRLVRGGELPPGWYGKPWACQQGADAATGAILLFTDADTTHMPALLGHAVAMLQREDADLLTVAPRQRIIGFWERTIMPQIWVMLGLRYHPDTVNAARTTRDVIANGQFMMFPRERYRALGGHAAVRGEVVEDLAMAQRVVREGRKLFFAFAYDLMATRMYRNLGDVVEGWSKNLFIGSRLSYVANPLLRPFATLLMMAHEAFWLVPPVALLLAISGVLPGLLLPALLATGLAMAFWSLISFGMQAPMWYGLCYPAGAAMTLYIIARSRWRGRGKVEWRGRVYDERSGAPTSSALS